MITLRSFSIAIIENNDKVLMMERSMERKFAPGLWTVVGGHIEPSELNDPSVTCVREIEEETAPAFVIALKSVLLPTFGKPTIPNFI